MEKFITYTPENGKSMEIKIYKNPQKEELEELIKPFLQETNPQILEIYLRTGGYFSESINYYFMGYENDNCILLLWATASQENQTIAFSKYLYIEKTLNDPNIPTTMLKKATEYLFEQGVKVVLLNTPYSTLYNSYGEIGYKHLLGDKEQNENLIMFTERENGLLNNLFREEKSAYWIERRNLSNGDLALLQLLYSYLNVELLSNDEAFLIKNYPQGIITGNEVALHFSKFFSREPLRGYPIFLNKVEMGNNLIRSIATVKKRELPVERIVDFDFYFLEGFQSGFYNLVEELTAELANFPHIILEYRGFNKKKIDILKHLGFKEHYTEEEYFLYQGEKIDIAILRKTLP